MSKDKRGCKNPKNKVTGHPPGETLKFFEDNSGLRLLVEGWRRDYPILRGSFLYKKLDGEYVRVPAMTVNILLYSGYGHGGLASFLGTKSSNIKNMTSKLKRAGITFGYTQREKFPESPVVEKEKVDNRCANDVPIGGSVRDFWAWIRKDNLRKKEIDERYEKRNKSHGVGIELERYIDDKLTELGCYSSGEKIVTGSDHRGGVLSSSVADRLLRDFWSMDIEEFENKHCAPLVKRNSKKKSVL